MPVTVAIVSTFIGVGLALLGVVLYAVAIFTVFGSDNGPPITITVVSAGFNLIAGTAATVTGVFAMRGSNPARITLCVLCAAFAGWKLACGGTGFLNLMVGYRLGLDPQLYRFGFGFAAAAIDLLLMVLALGILVLLLVGPSHRYFNSPKLPR